MKIQVTYRPLITKEIEVDEKYRELLPPTPDDASLEEINRLDDLFNGLCSTVYDKLPDCDGDIYNIVGPEDVFLYEG